MKSFFSNRFTWFVAGMLVISLVGCAFWSPSAKLARKEAAVAKVEQKLDDNKSEIVEKAKVFAKGTDLSLALVTNKSPYIDVARDFSSRTVSTLGEPKLEDVNNLKDIIAKLTSDQKDLIAKGRKLLEETDKEVYRLQEEKKSLQEQLIQKEEKYKEIAKSAAAMGDMWYKIKYYSYWIIGIIAFIFIASMVSQALPAPYGNILYLLCLPFTLIIKGIFGLIPKLKDAVGVVGKKTYDETQKALQNVVVSVEEAKTKVSAANEAEGKKSVGLSTLKAELDKNTDGQDKIIISQTKQALGYF